MLRSFKNYSIDNVYINRLGTVIYCKQYGSIVFRGISKRNTHFLPTLVYYFFSIKHSVKLCHSTCNVEFSSE